MSSYIGSVRFFKNLIFLFCMTGIIVPTVLFLQTKQELKDTRLEVEALTRQVQVYRDKEQSLSPLGTIVAMDANLSSLMAENDIPVKTEKDEVTFDTPAYQELFPDFYAPQELTADQEPSKTAYLTFDDGPSVCTDQILDILAEYDVPATFYIVGSNQNDETTAQRLLRMVEEGHTIGMHSGSHQYRKIYASVEAYLEDMYQVFCLIRDVTGVTPTTFRCPGGSINGYNAAIYQEILAEMLRRGFVPCDWNLSSEDSVSSGITSQQIVHNITDKSSRFDRAFVLMHDAAGKNATVGALSEVITQLTEQGFTFSGVTPDTKTVLFSYSN